MQAPTSQEGGAHRGRTPGAMTQAMGAWVTASERVVRVALTRGDRIETEIMASSTLHVGAQERCDVVVPDSRYRGQLFVRRKQGWVLRVPEGVAGKLANGGPVQRIVAGAAREIPLGPDARGRLETSDGALLFQLVVPPPAMPAPKLPASVQHGVFGAIDWHFTAITVAVFMLFFGATVMLEAADWPMAMSPLDQPELRALVFIDAPPPPPDPAATWAQQDPVPENIERDDQPQPEVESPPQPTRAENRPSRPGRQASSDNAEVSLSRDEIRTGIVLAIGTLAGDDGAFSDMLADGGPTTDHAQLFEDIEGVEYARNNGPTIRDTHRCSGAGCSDRPGNIRDMVRRPAQIATNGPTERAPLGQVDRLPMDPIDVDDDFDPAALVRRIRGKSRAIGRCYELHLTRDPTLAGRIDAEVTVMRAGNVRVDIATNNTGSEAVGACVQRHLSEIRLPQGPEGGPVTLGFPFVFSAQR